MLNSGQLTLLHPIPLQQRLLLLPTQQNMLRHKLVLRNINQQIILLEQLNLSRLHRWYNLHCGGRDADSGDTDAGVIVVLGDVMAELPHLLDTEFAVSVELYPDCADLRFWVQVLGRGRICVLRDHGGRRARGERHLNAIGPALGVCEALLKLGEGDVDFFFCEFVALGFALDEPEV